MFKRILVGYDLSERSRRALAIASGPARAFRSSLTVVHVLALPPVLKRWSASSEPGDLKSYDALLKRQMSSAQADLESRVARLVVTPLLDVRCLVRAGIAPNALVDVADRIDADLIVVGRGKQGMLGPTAERVVRLAGRSVLVAPVGKRSRPGAQFGDADRRRTPRGRIDA